MVSGARKFLACLFLLMLPVWKGLAAQKFPIQPPKPPVGFPMPDVSAAEERALGHMLDNELPLRLDATTAFSTTSTIPGEPFAPRPLTLDAATLLAPLPPGDYTVPVFAF